MKDKIVLITGASSGIGKETAKAIAMSGAVVVLACRNFEKSQHVLESIKQSTGNNDIHLMQLNLASIASIKKLADEFKSRFNKLDILINNAGVFCERRMLTEDGLEMTMGVNYWGTKLLTELLIPILCKGGKIINVVSKAGIYGKLNLNDLNIEKGYSGFKAYSTSKLALIIYSLRLSEILKPKGITVNAAHPGNVATNIWTGNSMMMKLMSPIMKKIAISPEEGAQTSIYLTLSPDVEGITGKLYFKDKIIKIPEKFMDKQYQEIVCSKNLLDSKILR